tara:strand:- start:85 stop:384 length:300 start_codon:yes stop_codon:yes gene_type:complete
MNIQDAILQSLQIHFPNSQIDLINESHMHAVPKNAETHFKVVIVDESFSDLTILQRHKEVYASLGNLIDKIHAFSMFCFTEDEYNNQSDIPISPDCAKK